MILHDQVLQIAQVLEKLADKDDTEWVATAQSLRRLADCMRNNEHMISGIDIVDCMNRELICGDQETLLITVEENNA